MVNTQKPNIDQTLLFLHVQISTTTEANEQPAQTVRVSKSIYTEYNLNTLYQRTTNFRAHQYNMYDKLSRSPI